MNIRLHIERLVLDGLPLTRRQGEQVQAAVEAELTRLLSEGGIPHQWNQVGAVPSAPGRRIGLSATSAPQEIGRQVALGVYGGTG